MRARARALVLVAGAGALVVSRGSIRRAARRVNRALHRRAAYTEGRLEGAIYRAHHRHPDLDVSDDVLADRIRSSLGPLEKRLDIPHVHVLCEGGVARLHGEVGSDADAATLERAVLAVPGVVAVRSRLHVGLVAGDTRPSQGAAFAPRSEAFDRLVGAVVDAVGVDRSRALRLARTTLATFSARIPAGERAHLLAHLPEDARALVDPPRTPLPVIEDAEDLAMAIATDGDLTELPLARLVAESELAVLRELVPEEAPDIAAVLPEGLRALWTRAVPA